MLTIRLEGPFGRWSKMAAAATFFRMVGPSIRNGPNNREVALYRAGRWHRASSSGSLFVLTGPFFAVVMDGPVGVRFEDDGGGVRTVGPFNQVRMDHGQLIVRDETDRVLAHLDENLGRWQLNGDTQAWPVVVFTQDFRRDDKRC